MYENNPSIIHENIRYKFICHSSKVLKLLRKIPMEYCHLKLKIREINIIIQGLP
jgi:hypothetical protein